MPDSLPFYLVGPEGRERRRLLETLGPAAEVFDDPAHFGDPAAHPPGLVLAIRADVEPDALMALAESVADAGEGWCLATASGPPEERVRVLSMGFPHTLSEVRRYIDDPRGARGTLLELRGVLREISHVRHDVNNPLTSALAEVQLILFDAEEGELRESMEVVQEQLRRIRDLIASTSHLRVPSSPR